MPAAGVRHAVRRAASAPHAYAPDDTFAVITRPGRRLSPGVRVLLADVEAHMRRVADALGRSR